MQVGNGCAWGPELDCRALVASRWRVVVARPSTHVRNKFVWKHNCLTSKVTRTRHRSKTRNVSSLIRKRKLYIRENTHTGCIYSTLYVASYIPLPNRCQWFSMAQEIHRYFPSRLGHENRPISKSKRSWPRLHSLALAWLGLAYSRLSLSQPASIIFSFHQDLNLNLIKDSSSPLVLETALYR